MIRLSFPLVVVPDDVGDRVLRARRDRGWSQARLAGRAGISRASVYRLEAGDRGFRADTLFRIAHALAMPIADFAPSWPEWDPIRGAGLGDGVRERRRAVGMTLAELAHAAGVSEATMSRHERGIVASPRLVRRVGDELVACNEALETALRDAEPA